MLDILFIMGSMEVYDYQQQRWVPYVPDPEEWYQHLKDLRDGYVQPDNRGRYVVGSGESKKRVQILEAKLKEANRALKDMEEKLKHTQQPVVKMVTPVAQANAIARSEVDREKQRKNGDDKKRKNITPPLTKSKRRRTIYDPDSAL